MWLNTYVLSYTLIAVDFFSYRKRIKYLLSFPIYQTHKDSREYNAFDITDGS